MGIRAVLPVRVLLQIGACSPITLIRDHSLDIHDNGNGDVTDHLTDLSLLDHEDDTFHFNNRGWVSSPTKNIERVVRIRRFTQFDVVILRWTRRRLIVRFR